MASCWKTWVGRQERHDVWLAVGQPGLKMSGRQARLHDVRVCWTFVSKGLIHLYFICRSDSSYVVQQELISG